ncbi:D-alanine--D-alanine ligase [Methylacidiphilum kamchatkense Kam1]|uniref:D-alanine--D-alanine ligase n=1 Tax=Methylacidiphilum kamchatkense Kam1 TaxID=1202785 RepID=A0A0C1RMZ2_9BACT|nr:D-alanine--D-alanine ligase [Methylacidiphilum kamchatkense]KIE59377.1 D-alanine--D-alanine ligase [Methylacidiphilum kamchatkense Kam1]QDQ42645.1 D-alanine-D-alanine ligase [Methylacidiphilum kamchatkense Kam1]
MKPGLPKHITVLKGGPSAERQISLKTASAVESALCALGYELTAVDVINEKFELPESTEICFLCIHGTFGEDGQIQRLLMRRGIPFTGSDAASSEKAFDKVWSKKLFVQGGIPTPPFFVVGEEKKLPFGPPYVIKPSRQGSSIGVEFVYTMEDFEEAVRKSKQFDHVVIAETLIKGRELTVAILDNKALPIVEIKPKKGFYDYQNKYTKGASEYICPALLTKSQVEAVQKTALDAFHVLGCSIYGRVDIILSENGVPWVLEINTIPGMTETSLFPMAAKAAGLNFAELCEKIVELSFFKWRARESFGVRI